MTKYFNTISSHYVKGVQIWSFLWSLFPAFGLNTDRYGVSFRIMAECGKIRIRKKLCIWTLFTQCQLSAAVWKSKNWMVKNIYSIKPKSCTGMRKTVVGEWFSKKVASQWYTQMCSNSTSPQVFLPSYQALSGFVFWGLVVLNKYIV